MNSKTRVLFLISFLFKEFASISAAPSNVADKYDITKELNDTIVGIFQIVKPQNVAKLIDSITNIDSPNNFTWNNGNMNILFYDFRVTSVISNATWIHYDFTENEMKISSSEFIVNLTGFIALDEDRSLHFESNLNIRNVIMKASKRSSNNPALGIDIPSPIAFDIKLDVNPVVDLTAFKMFEYIIPLLFYKNINQNQRFTRFLEEMYDVLTKQRIISNHADFSDDEYRYHYLIPKATFTLYTLRNIRIQGLSNFQWLYYSEEPLTNSLKIKHIRGSVDLCSGPAISELRFFINTLSITIEQDTNRIQVAAEAYSVDDSKTNKTFSPLHSAVIMELMELTIASSIMPSMEFRRTMKPRSQILAQQTTEEPIPEVSTTTPLQTKRTTSAAHPFKKYPTRRKNTFFTTQASSTRTLQSSADTTKEKPARTTTPLSPSTERTSPNSTTTTKVKTVRAAAQSFNPRSTQNSTDATKAQITTATELSDTDTTKVKITQMTAQSDSKWTPQEETTTATDSDVAVTPDQLNYHLLFNDVTVKLISGNQSYPQKFQCDLVNKLQFIHKVDAVQLGTKHKPGDKTVINFLANISSINISVVKLNNSNNSDSCQYQIHVNQIIDVKPPKLTGKNIHSGINYEVWKRINPVLKLIRNETEHIVQTLKPRVCSTLDVCSQSVKMAKDVFLRYIDNVLSKSSLRKRTTLTKSTLIF